MPHLWVHSYDPKPSASPAAPAVAVQAVRAETTFPDQPAAPCRSLRAELAVGPIWARWECHLPRLEDCRGRALRLEGWQVGEARLGV
jgi:hypothetical protein